MAEKHIIDLGDDDVKFTVKYKGQEYNLREPLVSEVESLKDGDKLNAPEFLGQLGMPSEVVSSMGISKARALIDGLMELVTKKK